MVILSSHAVALDAASDSRHRRGPAPRLRIRMSAAIHRDHPYLGGALFHRGAGVIQRFASCWVEITIEEHQVVVEEAQDPLPAAQPPLMAAEAALGIPTSWWNAFGNRCRNSRR
jgi:hypothetical protein